MTAFCDQVVAEGTEIIREGPRITLTEISNTSANSSNELSTMDSPEIAAAIDCPFTTKECCVQNVTQHAFTNATEACVSAVCAIYSVCRPSGPTQIVPHWLKHFWLCVQ